MDLSYDLLGLNADQLTALQMSFRALIIFCASLLFVRLGGIRTLGRKSTFDQITTLILGTLMGNAIFNSRAPFFPILLATFLIMMLHRLAAWITYKNHRAGEIIKGKPVLLIKDGVLQRKNMAKAYISENDILESLRLLGDPLAIEDIKIGYLERSGTISLVKKEK